MLVSKYVGVTHDKKIVVQNSCLYNFYYFSADENSYLDLEKEIFLWQFESILGSWQFAIHCVGQGTERGRRKFWEWHISIICLCSKYFKNWNIFGQILNIWVKLILKKKFEIFFSMFRFA